MPAPPAGKDPHTGVQNQRKVAADHSVGWCVRRLWGGPDACPRCLSPAVSRSYDGGCGRLGCLRGDLMGWRWTQFRMYLVVASLAGLLCSFATAASADTDMYDGHWRFTFVPLSVVSDDQRDAELHRARRARRREPPESDSAWDEHRGHSWPQQLSHEPQQCVPGLLRGAEVELVRVHRCDHDELVESDLVGDHVQYRAGRHHESQSIVQHQHQFLVLHHPDHPRRQLHGPPRQ